MPNGLLLAFKHNSDALVKHILGQMQHNNWCFSQIHILQFCCFFHWLRLAEFEQCETLQTVSKKKHIIIHLLDIVKIASSIRREKNAFSTF